MIISIGDLVVYSAKTAPQDEPGIVVKRDGPQWQVRWGIQWRDEPLGNLCWYTSENIANLIRAGKFRYYSVYGSDIREQGTHEHDKK